MEEKKKGVKTFLDKIGASFHRKGFRSGVYATVTSVLVIVAVIVVNLIVSASGIQKDLTATGSNSLTEETKELVSGLEDDLTFYYLTKEGETLTWLDPSFAMYMELYERASDRIHFETVDLLLNPKFTEQYTQETVIQYSMVVVNESTGLSKYISAENMVLTELVMDPYTFQYKTQVTGLDIEGQVNAAIRYVISGEQTKLYAVTGHGELTLGSEGQNVLQKANISYNTLETMTAERIPEDCDVLLVYTPTKDYSDAELLMLKEYADRGGDFLISVVAQDGLDRFSEFLAYCGVKVNSGIVIEGNSKYHNTASALELYPNITKVNDITATLDANYLPMTNCFSLTAVQDGVNEFDVAALLTTSEDSFLKSVADGQVILTKQEGDPEGPFTTAMYLENKETKSEAVVLGSVYVFHDQYLMLKNFGNAGLLTNSVNYMAGAETVSTIRTISFDSEEMLTVNAAQANAIAVVFVIVIPVLMVVFGIYIMLRRRNR